MATLRQKHLIPILAFTLFFICFMPALSYATQEIPEQQWQQIIQDKAFDYKDVKEMAVMKQQKANTTAFAKIMAAIVAFFFSTAGKTLVWMLIFLLIVYIFYKAFLSQQLGLNTKTKKINRESENHQQEPEDIMTADWEEMRKSAIAHGDMRLAIRCGYMQLLQLLQQKGIINYRSDKTNHDYFFELKDHRLKQPFRQLTKQYEYVWYGNYPVQENLYESYMHTFKELKEKLHRS